jgi:hypothetical protein
VLDGKNAATHYSSALELRLQVFTWMSETAAQLSRAKKWHRTIHD